MYKVEVALSEGALSSRQRHSFTGEAHTVRGLEMCVMNLVKYLYPRIEPMVLNNGIDTITSYAEKDAISKDKVFKLSFGNVTVSILKAV